MRKGYHIYMAKDNNQGVKAVLQIRSTGSDARWKELWRWLLAPSQVSTGEDELSETCNDWEHQEHQRKQSEEMECNSLKP